MRAAGVWSFSRIDKAGLGSVAVSAAPAGVPSTGFHTSPDAPLGVVMSPVRVLGGTHAFPLTNCIVGLDNCGLLYAGQYDDVFA